MNIREVLHFGGASGGNWMRCLSIFVSNFNFESIFEIEFDLEFVQSASILGSEMCV
jgi:hypothetical protein